MQNTTYAVGTISKEDLIKKSQITDLIEPLKKEVELAEEFLSASLKVEKRIIDTLKPDDKLNVKIIKDTFGSEELAVYTLDGTFLGFIGVNYISVLKNLMKAGKLICARVVCADHIKVDDTFSFSRVRVKVFMVDF